MQDADGFPPVFIAAIASVSGQTQKEIALYLWTNGPNVSLDDSRELSLKQRAVLNFAGGQKNQWLRERGEHVDAAIARLNKAKNGVNANDYAASKT